MPRSTFARFLPALLCCAALLAACTGGSEPAASSAGTVTPTVDPATGDAAVPTAGAEPTPEPTVAADDDAGTDEPPVDEPSGDVPAPPFAAPPTPVPLPIDDVDDGCRSDDDRTFDIVDVAPDDPDGGLVVHSEIGIDAPVTGILPWYVRDVRWTGRCGFTPSGAEWWEISGPGQVFGWVNARFLGQRPIVDDDLAVVPCSLADGTDLPPEVAGGSSANYGETFVVTDIRVQSTGECDRVVIEFGTGWDFDAIPRPLDAFPIDSVTAILIDDHELQLELNPVFADAFSSIPPAAIWRDAATDEQNVALVLDRDDHTEVHVGWGTGVAGVSFASFPARVIVDIVQEPTPDGELAGPIVGADGVFGPILFEPPVDRLHGDGATGPLTVRGYSRGFESSSYLDIRPWRQTTDDHPGSWNGQVFADAEPAGFAPRPVGLELDPPLPDWADPALSISPFSTPGYFEIEVSGLEPGGWQLVIVPSTGLGCADVVGQQFRIAGAGPSDAPMAPFTITRTDIDEAGPEPLVATTTTSVLGTEWITRGVC